MEPLLLNSMSQNPIKVVDGNRHSFTFFDYSKKKESKKRKKYKAHRQVEYCLRSFCKVETGNGKEFKHAAGNVMFHLDR